jgi:hypothetical protein
MPVSSPTSWAQIKQKPYKFIQQNLVMAFERRQVQFVDAWAEELIAVTQEEIATYQNLLNQLMAQQSAIIDRDILRLTQCNQLTEASMIRAKDSSQKRSEKIKTGALHFRPTKELQSLEQVIPIVKKHYAERLTDLSGALRELLGRIRESNGATQYLLQHSLGHVHQELQLMYDEIEKTQAYGTDGKKHRNKSLSTVMELA